MHQAVQESPESYRKTCIKQLQGKPPLSPPSHSLLPLAVAHATKATQTKWKTTVYVHIICVYVCHGFSIANDWAVSLIANDWTVSLNCWATSGLPAMTPGKPRSVAWGRARPVVTTRVATVLVRSRQAARRKPPHPTPSYTHRMKARPLAQGTH